MKQTYTYDYTVNLHDDREANHIGEIDVRVTYIVNDFGSPAVMYLRNGDPGYPAEPAEIEVVGVKMALKQPHKTPDGRMVTVTDGPTFGCEWSDAWDWLADFVSHRMETEYADELAALAREDEDERRLGL